MMDTIQKKTMPKIKTAQKVGLSLVAQFDDICRSKNIITGGIEDEFIKCVNILKKFLEEKETMIAHMKEFSKILETIENEKKALEIRSEHLRYLLDAEQKRVKIIEAEKKNLEARIEAIGKLALSKEQNLNNEIKAKIISLSSTTVNTDGRSDKGINQSDEALNSIWSEISADDTVADTEYFNTSEYESTRITNNWSTTPTLSSFEVKTEENWPSPSSTTNSRKRKSKSPLILSTSQKFNRLNSGTISNKEIPVSRFENSPNNQYTTSVKSDTNSRDLLLKSQTFRTNDLGERTQSGSFISSVISSKAYSSHGSKQSKISTSMNTAKSKSSLRSSRQPTTNDLLYESALSRIPHRTSNSSVKTYNSTSTAGFYVSSPETESREIYTTPTTSPRKTVSEVLDEHSEVFTILSIKKHEFTLKHVLHPNHCTVCGYLLKSYTLSLQCLECESICHRECQWKIPIPCIPTPKTSVLPIQRCKFASYSAGIHPFIPTVLNQCIREIERRGLHVTYLYEIASMEDDVHNFITNYLNHEAELQIETKNIHAICNIVLHFLKALKEPLIPRKYWSNIRIPRGNKDLYKARVNCCLQLRKLPVPHFDTLTFIIAHLQKISRNAYCKMSIKKLSKIFAPIILGVELPGSRITSNRNLHLKKQQNEIMQFILNISREFWTRY